MSLLSLVACVPRGTSSTASASSPPLPACAPQAPESYPCRTPFDVAPVVEEQPTDAGSGERRTAHVWLFVDEAGVVRAAQIGASAGVDYDIAAVARAKRFRFRPATASGRPVPAWVIVPVITTPEPESCPVMAVPLSAGVVTFGDSAVLERPELGTRYRFRGEERIGLGGLMVDVFIYPGHGWSSSAGQATVFLEALDTLQRQGRIAGFEVLRSERESIRLSRAGRTSEIVGHMLRLRMTLRPGDVRESYFAVFPDGERYLKFRATYAPSRATRDAVDTVVRQVLSARAARPAHCPR